MVLTGQPRIGMLWGDFPWTSAPKKLGKLWSMGRVARDVTRALRENMQVIPFCPPENKYDDRESMASFLISIDVLWADLYPSSSFALSLRDELGLSLPTIFFAGGALPKGAEAMLFPWQRLVRPYDGILFSCQADQAIWKRLIEWSNLKEWVIPLSVDEQVFYPRSNDERVAVRMKYEIPVDSPLLLYVGRLNIQKNLHTLFHLFAAVSEEIPNVHLCIVGEEDDIVLGEFRVRNTGYVELLRTIANNLGIAERIRFIGSLFGEDLAQMYSAADVVTNVGFYHRENFGLSQAEAAACGVPVVCTAWGGFKDVVQNGETGYFLDAILTKNGIRVDWANGAASIIRLLQQHDLREDMGRRAANYALDHFSIAALTRNLVNVVAEIQHKEVIEEDPFGSVAYKPSQLAEQYEAHKRTCGWYASSSTVINPNDWHPPMFQGEQYKLYEKLIQPYSTLLAQEVEMSSVTAERIPYFPSPVKLDTIRLLATNEDPVWPHRRFLSTGEWNILKYVDGKRMLREIVNLSGSDLSTCISIVWNLYLDGLLLFNRTISV